MLVEHTPLPPSPTAICARPQNRSALPSKDAKRSIILCRAWLQGPGIDAQIDKELAPKQKSPGGGTNRGFHSNNPEGPLMSLPEHVRKAQSISPPLAARPKRRQSATPLLPCACTGSGGTARAGPPKRQALICCRRFIGRRTIRRNLSMSMVFFRLSAKLG